MADPAPIGLGTKTSSTALPGEAIVPLQGDGAVAATVAGSAPVAGPESLEALARVIEGNDTTGERRRQETRRILAVAEQHLQTSFKPEGVAEGEIPSAKKLEALVLAALRAGYNHAHRDSGETVGTRNTEIKHLIKPFTAYVTVHARDLRLVGTKPATRARAGAPDAPATPLPTAALVAIRVVHARGIADALPPDLKAEAEKLIADLKALGRDEREVATALHYINPRREAVEALDRLAELRSEAALQNFEATAVPDFDGADEFMARLAKEIDEWLREQTLTAIDPDLLRRTVRTYIAFWLAGKSGVRPERLKHSQEALQLATRSVAREVAAPEARRELTGLANQLAHALVRIEGRQGRTVQIANGAPLIVEASRGRVVNSPAQLDDALGDELAGELMAFYAELRDEQGPLIARQFLDFMTHYVRFAAHDYGDDLRQKLREQGLEPKFVRAIFDHVGDGVRFSDASLEMADFFFAEKIGGAMLGLDAFALLRTEAHAATAAVAPAEPAFASLRYDASMGMREFMADLDVDPKEFQDVVGIAYQAFLNWGSIRLNAAKLSDKNWEAMVAFAAEEGRLRDLLLAHRPPHIASADDWRERIDAAEASGKLQELALAKTNRPAHITDEEWGEYVRRLGAAGRLEDVTVEPRKRKGLDAVLAAYHYMQGVAGLRGRRIDFFDYLSAIYPIARRLQSRAGSDGALPIVEPQFMHGIRFHNWGYPTFAQQIYSSRFATDVVRVTLITHMRGEVEQPEYWDLRRYVLPLAAASGGGRDQEAALYEFAWLMRVVHLLDNAMEVRDSNMSRLTQPSDGVTSRFHVELREDEADYAEGIGDAADARARIFAEVRSGAFQERLDQVGAYLDALHRLPADLALTAPDGESTSLTKLNDEHRELERQHIIFSATLSDRSPMAAYRSPEERHAISDFYRRVNRFVDRTLFRVQVRGSLATPRRSIPFQTMPRVAGNAIVLIGGEFTTVQIEDIAAAAVAEVWPPARVHEVMRLRILLTHLQATGEVLPAEPSLEEIRSAATPLWPEGEPLSDAAISDYLRVDEALQASLAKAASGIARIPTGGDNVQQDAGPFLPWRRVAPGWEEQFVTFAAGRGMSEAAARRGVAAIEDYIQTTQHVYQHFWPQTLHHIMEAKGADPSEAAQLYDAAIAFFPSIGLVATAAAARELDPKQSTTAQIARWAVDDYLELFPPARGEGESAGWRIPVNLRLLSAILARHLEEYREASHNRSLAAATARQLLSDLNAVREPAPWTHERDLSTLPAEGMLGERLAPHIARWGQAFRRAYFQLLPRIRRQESITRNDVEAALQQSHGEGAPSTGEVEDLEAFIGEISHDLERVIALTLGLTHSSATTSGGQALPRPFGRFPHPVAVSESSRSQGDLLAFAYAAQCLTGNLPIDLNAMSFDLVDPALAPYGDATEWMARSYAYDLARGWAEAEHALLAQVAAARDALEAIAQDAAHPPQSSEEFLQHAAALMDSASFEVALQAERSLRLVGALRGSPLSEPSLTELAQQLYEDQVVPHQEAKARADRAAAEALRVQAEHLADLQTRSAALAVEWSELPDLHRLYGDALTDYVERTARGLEALAGLRGEFHDVLPAALPAGRKEAASADASLATTEANLREWNAAAEGRRTGLARDRRVKDLAEKMTEAAETLEKLNTQRDQLTRAIQAAQRRAAAVIEPLTTQDQVESGAFSAAVDALHTFVDEFNVLNGHLLAANAQANTIADSGLIAEVNGITDEIAGRERFQSASRRLGRAIALNNGQEKLRQALRDKDNGFPRRMEGILDRAENRLQPGKGWSLPPSPTLPESETIMVEGSEVVFSETKPKEDYRSKAAGRMNHVIDDLEIIVMPKGNVYVSSATGRKIDDWKRTDRESPLTIDDIFGSSLEIPQRFGGVRVISGEAARNLVPIANARWLVQLATAETCHEAELLYRLSPSRVLEGKGPEVALLRDLLAAAVRQSVATPAEARRLIRRFALAHRDELSKIPGVASLFVEATPKASTPPPPAPSVRDPRRLGPGRPIVPEAERGRAVSDKEMKRIAAVMENPAASVPPFENTPYVVRFSALSYQLNADLELAELAWLHRSEQMIAETAVILGPIALTPPGREPPLSLDDAQEIAVEVWQKREELDWLFGNPDAELARRFPEIAFVGVHAKYRALAVKGEGEAKARLREMERVFDAAMEHFRSSDLAGLFSLTLAALNIFPDLAAAWKNHVATRFQGVDASGDTTRRLRAALVSFYEAHGERIHEALSKELRPGMTYARSLTGFDRPWDVTNPNSWEAYSAVDRLRMVVPEMFLVRPDFSTRLDTMAMQRPDDAPFPAVRNAFPDLTNFILIDFLLGADTRLEENDPLRASLIAILKAGAAKDVDLPRYLEEFARVHTTPEYVAAVRMLLNTPLSSDRNELFGTYFRAAGVDLNQTLAEHMTGRQKPWLPEIPPPPARSEPPPPAPSARDPRRLAVGRPVIPDVVRYREQARDNAEIGAQLIGDPQKTFLRAIGNDGKGIEMIVDRREAVRFARRETQTITMYDREGNATGKMNRAELNRMGFVNTQRADIDFNEPFDIGFLALNYLSSADPELEELGWLRMDEQMPKEAGDILRPIALTPPGREPPLSLDDAQEIAVEVWRNREKLKWLFVEPDAELAQRFPETALVGVHAKLEHAKSFKTLSPSEQVAAEALFQERPQIAAILTIIGKAASLVQKLQREYLLHMRAYAETLPAPRDFVGLKRTMAAFYEAHRDEIFSALQGERHPGITHWRYLTGFDEPWKVTHPNSWEAYDPIDRLRMTVPEAFAVHDELLTENVDLQRTVMLRSMHPEQSEPSTPFMQAYSDMNAQSPELRGLILLDQLMMCEEDPQTGEIVHKDLTATLEQLYLERAATMEVAPKGWLRRFAEFHASPRYLSVVRGMLKRTFAEGKNEQVRWLQQHFHLEPSATIAEALTGKKAPWLPEIPPPPARSEPPTAPPEPRPRELGPGRPVYGSEGPPPREEQAKFAGIFSSVLEHPEKSAVLVTKRDGAVVNAIASSSDLKGFFAGKRATIEVFDVDGERVALYDHLQVRRGDVTLRKVSRDVGDPAAQPWLRLRYAMSVDPGLAELAWLSRTGRMPAEVSRLLTPIAFTPPGREPPISLDDAQELAVEVWQNREKLKWLFVEPDAALGQQFPEIALVSAAAKYATWKQFQTTAKERDIAAIGIGKVSSMFSEMLTKKPELAELTVLFVGAIDADLAVGSEWMQYLAAERAKNRRDITDESLLAEALIAYYKEHRSRILTALEKEIALGMTYARRLTGFDRPGEVGNPNSWDAFSPLDRLHMVVPEGLQVPQAKIDDIFRAVENAEISETAVQGEGVADLASQVVIQFTAGTSERRQAFPELAAYIALDFSAMNRSDPEAGELISELTRLYLAPEEGEEWLRAFVELHTRPDYVSLLRRGLQRVSSTDPSKTYAEFYTGREKPWLPEIAASTSPARSEPPPAPPESTHGAVSLDSEYDAESHVERARLAKDILTHPGMGQIILEVERTSPSGETERVVINKVGDSARAMHDFGVAPRSGETWVYVKFEKMPPKGGVSFLGEDGNMNRVTVAHWKKEKGERVRGIELRAPPSADPHRLGSVQLEYRIASEPGLLALGSMTNQIPESGRAKRFSVFVNRLRTSLENRPPYTAFEAQEMMIAWYRRYDTDPKQYERHPLFTLRDEMLADEYPETAAVDLWPMAEIMQELDEHPTATTAALRKLMDELPQYAGALAILIVIAEDASEELRAAFAVPNIGNVFPETYAEHAEEIRRLLAKEVYPGMTRARWLTGLDEPWQWFPETWEEMDPAEAAALRSPELPPPFEAGIWGDPEKLLPTSDLARIDEMTEAEINERIDLLRLLPTTPMGLARLKEEQLALLAVAAPEATRDAQVASWRAESITGSRTASITQQAAHENAPLRAKLEAWVAAANATGRKLGFREEYRFLVRHRDEIIAHAVKVRDARANVIPAEAGISRPSGDPRLRGDDTKPPSAARYDAELHRRMGEVAAKKLKDPASDAYAKPTNTATMRTICRIHANPALEELGRLNEAIGKPGIGFFLSRLARPFARGTFEANEPVSLEEAQTLALQVEEDLEQGRIDERHPLLVRPDADLVRGFPETEAVGGWQLDRVMRELEAEPIAELPGLLEFMHAMPEFAGAAALVAAAAHGLSGEAKADVAAAMANGGPFRELYALYVDVIRAALAEEFIPGMSRARWLTGIDNPWEPLPESWEGMDPLMKLKFMIPEAERVTDDFVKRSEELIERGLTAVAGKKDEQKVKGRRTLELNVRLFCNTFPELRKTLCVVMPDNMMSVSDIEGWRVFFADFARSVERGEEIDRGVWEQRFVHLATQPGRMNVTRHLLLQKLNSTDRMQSFARLMKTSGDQTMAHLITGRNTPWLPDVDKPLHRPLPLEQLMKKLIVRDGRSETGGSEGGNGGGKVHNTPPPPLTLRGGVALPMQAWGHSAATYLPPAMPTIPAFTAGMMPMPTIFRPMGR